MFVSITDLPVSTQVMEVHMSQPVLLTITLAASVVGLIALQEATAAEEGSSHSYSLNDIIDLALERNPAMAGAAAAVRQSRGERAAAGAYLNPSINGSGGRGPFAIRDRGVDYRADDHRGATVGVAGEAPCSSRWVKVFGIIALVVILLFVILLLTHGPHRPGSSHRWPW
jgi:hypothetical protein